MFNIIDTSSSIFTSYKDGKFDLDKWIEYIDTVDQNIKEACLRDLEESISPDFSWDSYFLPVLNDLVLKKEDVEKISKIFLRITNGLEKKIIDNFGRSFDVDIILYLGLCNGAGWVTDIKGKTYILLGIEKILELYWDNADDMNGLILHELGHVYHNEFGILNREFEDPSEKFLWQLFTEGIAMVFEQEIMNDPSYFHQDIDGWKDWCEENIIKISRDFKLDYPNMTRVNQRYFGDLANYYNHNDVGYYLGARFVRFILQKDIFDNIIRYEIDAVKSLFEDFINSL